MTTITINRWQNAGTDHTWGNNMFAHSRFKTAMLWLTGEVDELSNYLWSDYLPEMIEAGRVIKFLSDSCGQFMLLDKHIELEEGFTISREWCTTPKHLKFHQADFEECTWRVGNRAHQVGTTIEACGISQLLDVLHWMEQVVIAHPDMKSSHWDGVEDFFTLAINAK